MFRLGPDVRRLVRALPFILFIVAFVPRLAALNRYVTPDELNWVYRSLGLRAALLAGDWAGTLQSGHPGMTTTWLGAVAAQLQLWLQPEAVAHLEWLSSLGALTTENAEAYRQLAAFLSAGRLAVATVTSLGIVFLYRAARPLLGTLAALLGALLLALDPFTAGLGGLLHVDALLATFALLALLLTLRAAREGSRKRALLAGIATALALLTKTPGLLLLVLLPLILLGTALTARRDEGSRRWLWLWWGLALLVTLGLLLPALWAAPVQVWREITGLSGRLVEDAVRPTFFLGQVALDHGPLFYPVAVLLRLSPVATVGVVLALFWLLRGMGRRKLPRGSDTALWLLLFGLLFLAGLTLAAKKFDRYALPALAAFALCGGWGLALLARSTAARVRLALVAAAAVMIVYLGLSWPYPLMAYNWLAGGRAAAVRALPQGWGEAEGVGARWLADEANADTTALFTYNLVGTAPFYPGPIVGIRGGALSRITPGDYVLLPLADRQLRPDAYAGEFGDGWKSFPGNHAPAQTLAWRGQPLAELHTELTPGTFGAAPLTMEAAGYRFGGALALASAGSQLRPWPHESVLALGWERLPDGAPAQAYQVQMELVDASGRRARREVPLLNEDGRGPAQWESGKEQILYEYWHTPPDLPPGDYQFIVRVFDDAGQQLAVYDGDDFAGIEVVAAENSLTAPDAQPPLTIPGRGTASGPLAGFTNLPEQAGNGERVQVDLWWRPAVAAQTLALQVGPEEVATRIDMDGWPADQVFHIRPVWRLPFDLAAGTYPVRVVARDATGAPLMAPALLGELAVERWDRSFELPPGLEPLAIHVDDVALLQGASATVEGEELIVTVVWQATNTMDTVYTAFVHLRDAEGNIVAQTDLPPWPRTDTWAPGEVVVNEFRLPQAGPGQYEVAVGLYNSASGQRLPLTTAEGARLPAAQYTFEVTVP